jgi:hypothetical protein
MDTKSPTRTPQPDPLFQVEKPKDADEGSEIEVAAIRQKRRKIFRWIVVFAALTTFITVAVIVNRNGNLPQSQLSLSCKILDERLVQAEKTNNSGYTYVYSIAVSNLLTTPVSNLDLSIALTNGTDFSTAPAQEAIFSDISNHRINQLADSRQISGNIKITPEDILTRNQARQNLMAQGEEKFNKNTHLAITAKTSTGLTDKFDCQSKINWFEHLNKHK